MSAGPGDKSRIYKTSDEASTGRCNSPTRIPKASSTAIAFWDASHGIVVGDPLDGRAGDPTTEDGGANWERRKTPGSLPNEGSFAASNSCLTLLGSATCGSRPEAPAPGAYSIPTIGPHLDGGALRRFATMARAAGIFSLAFADGRHGIAVGGDYSKDKEDRQNIALTSDGGATWTAPRQERAGPKGFRSAVGRCPRSKALDRYGQFRVRRVERWRPDVEAVR